MPRIYSKSVLHLVDEFDFSGVSNQAQLNFDNGLGDVTAFADTEQTNVEGKGSVTFNIQGLLDAVASGYDAEMFIDLTSEGRRVGVFPPSGPTVGAAAGDYGYEVDANVSSQSRATAINEAIALNVDWRADGAPTRAILLDVDTAVNATGQGTAYEKAAVASTDTIVGILRLLSISTSGSNTLDVTIDSDDVENFGGTPETQLTFTQLDESSVALIETVSAAGSITDTWWRIDYVYAGGGSCTFSLVISFGIRPT